MATLRPRRGAGTRLLRRTLLAQGRRMDPQRLAARSAEGVLRAARQAARDSAAYRVLLHEAGLTPADLDAGVALARLPAPGKDDTFGRFTLAQLSRPLATTEIADVLTSSGRGGPPFGFRLSSRQQHEGSWFGIDLGLQDMFAVDQKPALLVNCLPMGVVFRSRAVAVANVSVREDMACAILREVGPRFAQTLLCTDPLFVRRVLAQARTVGIDWAALNTSVILGEEMLTENQRDYLAAAFHLDPDRPQGRVIGSTFGVGELGLNLLFETRETIGLRRALRDPAAAARWLALPAADAALPSLFCHNPLRCHVDVLRPDDRGWGELCFTMLERDPVIPLPRYRTGDLGRLVPAAEVREIGRVLGRAVPWLPVVQVRGRLKDREPGLPSVEQVKDWLYGEPALADALSGAFRLGRGVDGTVTLALQAAPSSEGPRAPPSLARLRREAAVAGFGALHVTMVTDPPSSWGPPLDHERKFGYRTPPTV